MSIEKFVTKAKDSKTDSVTLKKMLKNAKSSNHPEKQVLIDIINSRLVKPVRAQKTSSSKEHIMLEEVLEMTTSALPMADNMVDTKVSVGGHEQTGFKPFDRYIAFKVGSNHDQKISLAIHKNAKNEPFNAVVYKGVGNSAECIYCEVLNEFNWKSAVELYVKNLERIVDRYVG